MTTNRFQVTTVKEINCENQHSENIPLLNIENDVQVPSPPPLPSSVTLINETHKSSPRLINTFLQRLKTSSSSIDLKQKNDLSLLPRNQSNNNLNINKDNDEPDSCNSTLHTMDANSLHITNKFLHELRMKRREINEKAQNLSIDQRIALNRFRCNRDIIRAQDIFDVHFDEDNTNMATQEKIRNNIFNELDRQRIKKFHKQHRQLVLGRALLMFITSILLFMSITLIYVVIELYDRANYLNTTLDDNEFLSMIYDTATDN